MSTNPYWIAGEAADPAPRSSRSPRRTTARFAGRTTMATADDVEAAVAAADRVRGEFAAHPRARPRRRAGPRLPPAGRADRGDRAPDHRGVGQAAEVGAAGGGPRGLDVPLGRRGGPALVRARCSGWTPTRPRPAGWRWCAGCRAARCWASRRSTSRSTWSPTRWPRRSPSGAPIVLKPAPATPLSALLLGELLAETDLPAGCWSVLPVPNEVAARPGRRPAAAGRLVHRLRAGRLVDPRRGAAQARHPRARRQRGRVVAPDQDDDALAWAAGRIATFAMYQAGQSCISVQRVFAHRDVAAALDRAGGRGGAEAGHRRPDGRRHRRRPADRRAGRPPGRELGRRGGRRRRPAAHRRDPGRRRVRARPCSPTSPPTAKVPARRCSARSWCSTPSTRSTRPSPGQRLPVRAAGRRLHPRPAAGVPRRPGARGRRRDHRRRARASGPTRCPTAGSRTPASAAKACAPRWRTSPRSACSCSPASTCRRQESMFAITCLMRV